MLGRIFTTPDGGDIRPDHLAKVIKAFPRHIGLLEDWFCTNAQVAASVIDRCGHIILVDKNPLTLAILFWMYYEPSAAEVLRKIRDVIHDYKLDKAGNNDAYNDLQDDINEGKGWKAWTAYALVLYSAGRRVRLGIDKGKALNMKKGSGKRLTKEIADMITAFVISLTSGSVTFHLLEGIWEMPIGNLKENDLAFVHPPSVDDTDELLTRLDLINITGGRFLYYGRTKNKDWMQKYSVIKLDKGYNIVYNYKNG